MILHESIYNVVHYAGILCMQVKKNIFFKIEISDTKAITFAQFFLVFLTASIIFLLIGCHSHFTRAGFHTFQIWACLMTFYSFFCASSFPSSIWNHKCRGREFCPVFNFSRECTTLNSSAKKKIMSTIPPLDFKRYVFKKGPTFKKNASCVQKNGFQSGNRFRRHFITCHDQHSFTNQNNR